MTQFRRKRTGTIPTLDDLINLIVIGVFGLVLLIVVIGFPVYTLSCIASLRREVEELKNRLTHVETEAQRAANHTPPPVVPPLATSQLVERMAPILAERHPAVPVESSALPFAPRSVGRPSMSPVAEQPDDSAAHEASPERKFDIETVLGANWLAKLGIGAIAVAAAFFLQYAFRAGWIGPGGQVAIGLIVAASLTISGRYLLKKVVYRTYAQTLISGGMIVYYLSIYAAYSFYHPPVIAFGPAFALLVAGALAVSALAIADETQVVAALCILGAFATPVLIRQNGAAGAHPSLVLYAYLVFLNLWVAGLTRIRPWHSLSVLAFAGTWLIFFQAAPLNSSGWQVEGFASLFLLSSCYLGARSLYLRDASDSQADADVLTFAKQVGMLLIVGGCVAFGAASSLILGDNHVFELPGVALAGILLGVSLAAMGIALPPMGNHDRQIRLALGFCSAAAWVVMMAASLSAASDLAASQVAPAFGFIVFNYLVFLMVGLAQHRNRELESPAAALIAANTVIHIAGAWHVLHRTHVWSTPALAVWTPIAGCICLAALWITMRQRPDARMLPLALAASAQLLPLFGLLSVLPGVIESTVVQMPAWSAAILGLEFLLVSASWLVLRRRLAWKEARVDLLSAMANAAVFFGLLAAAIGTRQYYGFYLLAGCALLMAAYHACIARFLLHRDDTLGRLIYYGLAVTFVAIAIPLQFHAGYITAAWAVQAAALVWAGLKVNERRIRVYGLVLLTLAGCHALFIDFAASPAHFRLFLNSRTMPGADVIVAAYVCAWWLGKRREELTPEEHGVPWALSVAANLFTLVFVSTDLWDYAAMCWPAGGAANAQQLALSLFWTVYALAGVIVGIWKQLRPVRLFSMGLLCFSILKVVLFDLGNLATPYRIVSFFTLGVMLLLVSLLYTKYEVRLHGHT